MPPLSAGQRVFGLAELTESILRQNICSSQLSSLKVVNRFFYATITDSIRLRNQMFLVHVHDGADSPGPIKLNPMLVRISRYFPKGEFTFGYIEKYAVADGYVFRLRFSRGLGFTNVVNASKGLLEASAVMSTGLAAMIVANAPLKLMGEIEWCHDCEKQTRCSFKIDECITVGGLVDIFARKLDRLVQELPQVLADELQRAEETSRRLDRLRAAERARGAHCGPTDWWTWTE